MHPIVYDADSFLVDVFIDNYLSIVHNIIVFQILYIIFLHILYVHVKKFTLQ